MTVLDRTPADVWAASQRAALAIAAGPVGGNVRLEIAESRPPRVLKLQARDFVGACCAYYVGIFIRSTSVDAGTLGEPSKIEVRKNRRPIGRILHMAESLHVGETFQFHKGPISIALSAAAQFSSLEELKKWIRETQ